jgi:hypothetical protein
MINLPREQVDALIDAGAAALIAHGYSAEAKPHPRWIAAVILGALAPELIPGSTHAEVPD